MQREMRCAVLIMCSERRTVAEHSIPHECMWRRWSVLPQPRQPRSLVIVHELVPSRHAALGLGSTASAATCASRQLCRVPQHAAAATHVLRPNGVGTPLPSLQLMPLMRSCAQCCSASRARSRGSTSRRGCRERFSFMTQTTTSSPRCTTSGSSLAAGALGGPPLAISLAHWLVHATQQLLAALVQPLQTCGTCDRLGQVDILLD
jgi:hypothetical protein